MTVLFEALTRAKFTWFSVNYRLAPANRWPACFDDVQAAIRWVKAHAAEYGGDPKRIALIGYSAGGHIACLSAVRDRDDTRVQAVVGMSTPALLHPTTDRHGVLTSSLRDLLGRDTVDEEVRKTLDSISPINFVKPGLPPFLLIHGTADRSVVYEQSLNFQSRLKEAGVPCELITISNAPHNILVWETMDTSYKGRMTDWLARTLAAPK